MSVVTACLLSSDVDPLSGSVHFICGLELDVSEVIVEGSELHLLEFECEPWSDFLQVCFLAVLVELVSVVSKEDEVSLIVEGDGGSRFEVGLLREQTREESADSSTEFSVEIVQDEFGEVVGWSAVSGDVLVQLIVGDFEDRGGSLRQMD